MKKIPSKMLLKRKINKCVRHLDADNGFKKIIADILLRRMVQFDRTDAELQGDLEALYCNLSSIKIGESGEKRNHSTALAVYDKETKTVIISKEAFRDSYETIYQIIAHELFHVLFMNNRGLDKFDRMNSFIMMKSKVLEEIIAEKGSYQLVHEINDEPDGYNENAYGYDDIAFVLEFIEAAYGVNERDLIKNALNGRDRFEEFLAKAAGEELYETREFLDEIEVGASLIYSELYKNSSVKAAYVKYDKDMAENIVSGMDSMYEICQQKIEERLATGDPASVQTAKILKDEIALSETRLQNIVKNRLEFFRGELDYDVIALWKKCCENNSDELGKKLCKIEAIVNNKSIGEDGHKVELINYIIAGSHDEEFYKWLASKNGKEAQLYTISDEYLNQRKEKSVYVEGWNNKRICKYINSIAVRNAIDTRRFMLRKEEAVAYAQKTDVTKNESNRSLEQYKVSNVSSVKHEETGKHGASSKRAYDDEKNR